MVPGCDNGEGAVEPAGVIVAVALVVVSVKVEGKLMLVPEGLVGGGVGFMATAPIDAR